MLELSNEKIKHRKIIVSKPPTWRSKEEIKEIKIKEYTDIYTHEKCWTLDYEGTQYVDISHPPTDKEIEAFFQGVESERERFIDMLQDFNIDEKIIIEIEISLKRRDL